MNKAAAFRTAIAGVPPNIRHVERAAGEHHRDRRNQIGSLFRSRGTVALGLLAAAVGLAGPARADSWEPTPPIVPFAGSTTASDDAGTVVSNLTAASYKVMLNKIGSAPLDKCKVTSVTSGMPITQIATSGAKSTYLKVLYTTVYVTADCTPAAAASMSSSSGG
jgi:hypothetical protein